MSIVTVAFLIRIFLTVIFCYINYSLISVGAILNPWDFPNQIVLAF